MSAGREIWNLGASLASYASGVRMACVVSVDQASHLTFRKSGGLDVEPRDRVLATQWRRDSRWVWVSGYRSLSVPAKLAQARSSPLNELSCMLS